MTRLVKAVALLLAVVLLLLAGFFWWLQGSQWRAQTDAWLLEQAPYPVRYSHLGLAFLPAPVVEIQSLSMAGKRGDGQAYAKRIRLRPDFVCWISGELCGELEIDGLAVDAALLAELVADLKKNATGNAVSIPIEIVRINSLSVKLADGKRLGPYRLEARLSAHDGRPEQITLQRLDGRFSVVLIPTKTGGAFQVKARQWLPPWGPPLHFSRLQARGKWSADELVVSALTAQAYQGRISGGVRVDWGDGINFAAALDGQGLQLGPIIQVFGGHGVDGVFSGKLAVIAQGEDIRDSARNFFVRGPFEVEGGRIGMGRLAPMMLDRLAAYGRVDRRGLQLRTVALDAYDGHVEGTAMIAWYPAWLTQGQWRAQGLDSEPLLGCFIDHPVIGGRLSGTGRYRLEAATFAGLVANPDVRAELQIDDGAFYQVDLEKAQQGRTDFRTLHSQVRIQGHQQKFSSIEMVSDRINATGKIAVDEESKVSGGFDVSLRYTAGLVSFPVTLAGRLADVRVRPGGSALLGGVVGTGFMGPGIGTAIGARIGQFVGGLFTSDDIEN